MRGQCVARSCSETDVRCQRLVGHDGPHEASTYPTAGWHWSWADAAPAAGVLLPGTVWMERNVPSSKVREAARLAGELAGIACAAIVLSTPAAMGVMLLILGGQLLRCIRRAHFFDVGRFTAGVWIASPATPFLIFGLGWLLHGEGPKKAGLELVVGRVVFGVFAWVPRSQWPAFKRELDTFKVRGKGRRS